MVRELDGGEGRVNRVLQQQLLLRPGRIPLPEAISLRETLARPRILLPRILQLGGDATDASKPRADSLKGVLLGSVWIVLCVPVRVELTAAGQRIEHLREIVLVISVALKFCHINSP